MIAAAMGWLGTIGSISAYLMLSRGTWASSSIRYSVLNGLAGLLGAFASGVYGAWPSVTSNLLWAAIAAHSAWTTLRERRAVSAPGHRRADPGRLRPGAPDRPAAGAHRRLR